MIMLLAIFAATKKYYMINVHVTDETSQLKAVILGTAKGMGATPTLEEAYDPKSKFHIKEGTYPTEAQVSLEMEEFAEVLKKHGVQVLRPEVLENANQVFSRDIGFVIDETFVRPRILKNRREEIKGITHIIEQIAPESLIQALEGARMEGGDVMPWGDHIFVGYSKQPDFDKYIVSRTNEEGLAFLSENFPNRTVKGFELNKSDDDPYKNALHLDCIFQPVGRDKAIIHKDGFKNVEDYHFLVDYFGAENVVDIDATEMYAMMSNVFSISPEVVVSEKSFTRLNAQLRAWGFTVEEVTYTETAKMEGLLRCSTLPLIRS